MKYSPYQEEIFKAVKETNSNIIVQATAGSGKTTTIIEAAKRVDINKESLFVAFNKSIVEELRKKLPPTVDCSTLHSLGLSSLYGQFASKINIYNSKFFTFFDKALKEFPKKKSAKLSSFKTKIVCKDMVDKARLNLVPPVLEEIEKISDYYSITFNQDMLEIAHKAFLLMIAYNNSSRSEKMVDFTDMVWLPAIKDLKLKKYDVVFIDEAQDLNRAQQVLVEKVTKPKGRRIYVGDKNQAIYGFAGADAYSFQRLKQIPNTIELPLSISYRCSKRIVDEAFKIYPGDIEAFTESGMGIVRHSDWREIELGDMVVCRNVAPLISLYFDLLSQGKKAYIKGKDLEKGIINLLKKVEFMTIREGYDRLDDLLSDLFTELEKKGIEDPTSHRRYRNLEMQIDIIKMISEEGEKSYMKETMSEVQEIFKEDSESVQMMTIHKSKGLESKRVFFLSPELIPSKWASTPEDFLQENNLKFVAVTRAKESLFYIYNYELRQDR